MRRRAPEPEATEWRLHGSVSACTPAVSLELHSLLTSHELVNVDLL